jgi:hypothetical protein
MTKQPLVQRKNGVSCSSCRMSLSMLLGPAGLRLLFPKQLVVDELLFRIYRG